MLTIKASGYGLGGLFSKRKSQTLLGGAEFSDEKENAAQRDATIRADLDGAQLNGMHVDPSTLKITKISTPDSPLRVGDQIFAINGERVDALALIVHKDQSHYRGRALIDKMKELIPRQMFDIAIQAAIGNQVVSRVTVKALRKNVTAKCYGGDVSRKKKLLQKQKEGKKRMKQLGNVEVPKEAFLAVLKVDN